jgi:hypothetical protein
MPYVRTHIHTIQSSNPQRVSTKQRNDDVSAHRPQTERQDRKKEQLAGRLAAGGRGQHARRVRRGSAHRSASAPTAARHAPGTYPPTAPAERKRDDHLFSQLVLCLSRACLSKMITFRNGIASKEKKRKEAFSAPMMPAASPSRRRSKPGLSRRAEARRHRGAAGRSS